ncbi:WhiB family transcriptional regulator [Streptomyces sp. NPDC048361]|uniref:WhiB family transcriptional regulator n=1 Tax=Streptomyces sp. NPDC048361 TaxID=3154720 RepID=UPI0034342D42
MVLLGWSDQAVCKETDADAMFAEGARQQDAVAMCNNCPVRTQCLAHALDQRVEFGVWGGMTERERRALLRRRPGVASWHDLLRSAQAEYVDQLARGRAIVPRGGAEQGYEDPGHTATAA